jgi:phosphopantetheinyl transferase
MDGVHVTLSHTDGEAVALAVCHARAGIDLERVEARHPAFADEWFVPEERALGLDDAGLTRAWAIKEAVLKALGTGMALSPRDVVVTSIALGEAHVELRGEAARLHQELGGAPIRVRIGDFSGRVVATAVFAA